MDYAIGLDIGGTKIAAIITDEKGNIHYRSEVPSDSSNKENMFNQVVSCIEKLMDKSGLTYSDIVGIGAGVPGKVDIDNGIAIYQNNLPWMRFPLADRLKESFPVNNVVIDNDVYMAAFAEWQLSNCNNKATFVYLTISTGISCAIIHQGTFVRGAGFAGEIGLFPVPLSSADEKLETLEKAASGVAIERDGKEQLHDSDGTTKAVFDAFHSGKPEAKQIIDEVVKSISYGVYSIVCLLDPNKIILGGGVVNNQAGFAALIQEQLKYHLIKEQEHALKALAPSQLKENSGVVGAGLSVFNK